MKDQLASLFTQVINTLKTNEVIPADHEVNLVFERTRQKEHGDFACNVAMMLAKPARMNPRKLAEMVVEALPKDPLISKIDIAGPGFINVFLNNDAHLGVLSSVLENKDKFGLAKPNSKQKILVEFVSANPTGPLHVGHGRGAAYGDALARVLAAAGNQVEREYYVNDAGRQMDILAVSVWIRYLQSAGLKITLPANCYQGSYVTEFGQQIFEAHADNYCIDQEEYSKGTLLKEQSESQKEFNNLSKNEITEICERLNKDLTELQKDYEKKFLEESLDQRIAQAKSVLGDEGFSVFLDTALSSILEDIKNDLSEFGVDYDTWYSEKSLFDSDKIDHAMNTLKESGDVYEKGGAWWFRSTAYGDEKDRVVIRDNGQPTYFASDIAYHKNKIDRGFDLSIDVWGSDHHGYIPRVKASLQALGLKPEKLKVLLVQFAVLYRGGEKVGMSTRSGEFVTLRELREDIGSDAARFFYAMRKSEQHMDFDLDLAKAQNNENPMYYVQYAHARICRLFEKAQEAQIDTQTISDADFSQLGNDQEVTLLTLLQRFPEVVEKAASQFEPHQITYFLKDLATAYHSYYNSNKVLEAQESRRLAMLALSEGTRQVINNGLTILGVGAPTSM